MCKDTAAVCKGAREDKSIGRSTDRRTDRIASQLPKTHFSGDVYKPSTVVPVPPAVAVGERGPRTQGINRAGPSVSLGRPTQQRIAAAANSTFFLALFRLPIIRCIVIRRGVRCSYSRRRRDCITSASVEGSGLARRRADDKTRLLLHVLHRVKKGFWLMVTRRDEVMSEFGPSLAS